MNRIWIYQICYSHETRAALDPGFTCLDNLRNERPDWREYWPIRRFLQNNKMDSDAYYGFFSPKFGEKTRLDAAAVHRFIADCGGLPDVILFSPFFDQIAYPTNIFEQGASQHVETFATFKDCALLAEPGVEFDRLVMDSTNTVFCNFFVAKRDFWTTWLDRCESIFAIAEAGKTDLSRRLNAVTNHDRVGAPTKVFVIERMASLLLATHKHWKVKAFNPIPLPWSGSPVAKFELEMAFLDALKIAYSSQGHPQYLNAFHQLRELVNRQIQLSSQS